MNLFPRSLLGRTVLVIVLTVILTQLATTFVIRQFYVRPLLERALDDRANHIQTIVATITLLSGEQRTAFIRDFEDSEGAIFLFIISNIASIYGFHREVGHKNFGYFQMDHLPSLIWIHDQSAFVLSGKRSLANLELIAFKMRRKFE